MKLFLICLLLSLAILPGYPALSQSSGRIIDSLILALEPAAEDTNQVKLLNELAYRYVHINPDIGLNYGTLALQLANKLSFRSGAARSHSVIGSNLSAKSDYANALEHKYEALKYYEKTNDRRNQASLLHSIAFVLKASKKFEE